MTGGVLLVLDGWGHAPPGPGNAIAAARTPILDRLGQTGLSRLLAASGRAVGLPDGVVGNSEIGHLVIGAGRPLDYDSLLVEEEVTSGRLRRNVVLGEVCARLRSTGRTLHLVGLASDGRIHSDIAHFGELLNAVVQARLTDVAIHAITDGRDVAGGTAATYLAQLVEMTGRLGIGSVVSVIGRNYAMDKSGNAALTDRACRLVADGAGERAVDRPVAAWHANGDADDGWLPATTVGPARRVVDGDGVLFVNFRSDRTAPLADAIAERLAASGRRGVTLVSLAQYDTATVIPALVPRADASGGLADALETCGIRSVRIAEREKYEHVTFFVNGREPRARPLEEHICVPGKPDPDYTRSPEMNVADVASATCAAIRDTDAGLVIANLANIDVVGHTGDYAATVRAAECVDAAVGDIAEVARQTSRWLMVVGDHGNGEQMTRPGPHGARPYGGHTDNPVPCLLAAPSHDDIAPVAPGEVLGLPSVAPTALHLLDATPTPVMTAPLLWRRAGRNGTPE